MWVITILLSLLCLMIGYLVNGYHTAKREYEMIQEIYKWRAKAKKAENKINSLKLKIEGVEWGLLNGKKELEKRMESGESDSPQTPRSKH